MKRETCEKGATWTDWIPISSRQSRSAILRWNFLIIFGMLVVDFHVTRNGCSGTC